MLQRFYHLKAATKVLLMFFGVTLASCASSDANNENSSVGDGVCLMEPLKFVDAPEQLCFSADELASLYDYEVLQGGGKVAVVRLSHPTEDNQQQHISTCRKYVDKSAEGWYALTTKDMAMQGYFESTCSLLTYLEQGQSATQGKLPEVGTLFASLQLLPTSVIPEFRPAEKRAQIEQQDGATLDALVQSEEVLIEDTGPHHLVLSNERVVVRLEEMARGDFTQDGWEDTLMVAHVRAKQGTARTTLLFVVEFYGDMRVMKTTMLDR